ncbi:hypothetical protein BX616_005919, partial [Lobosporangium transversale]
LIIVESDKKGSPVLSASTEPLLLGSVLVTPTLSGPHESMQSFSRGPAFDSEYFLLM